MDRNDWRIRNQMEYLYQVELVKTNYHKKSKEWEHEHCEFCWVKFDDEGIIGYSARNGYYWICEDCFNDFNNMFDWKVINHL